MREDPVAAPAADFPEAQCLYEVHKIIEAHVGGVSAPDSSEEKVRLHTADATEEVRQDTPHQKIAAARRQANAYLTNLKISNDRGRVGRWVGSMELWVGDVVVERVELAQVIELGADASAPGATSLPTTGRACQAYPRAPIIRRPFMMDQLPLACAFVSGVSEVVA